MMSRMCGLLRSTGIFARRRTSRPRWPSLPTMTSRRRRRPGGSERSGRVPPEVVPVLDEAVEKRAFGGQGAEAFVNGLRNSVIGVCPAADEFHVHLVRG